MFDCGNVIIETMFYVWCVFKSDQLSIIF